MHQAGAQHLSVLQGEQELFAVPQAVSRDAQIGGLTYCSGVFSPGK